MLLFLGVLVFFNLPQKNVWQVMWFSMISSWTSPTSVIGLGMVRVKVSEIGPGMLLSERLG